MFLFNEINIVDKKSPVTEEKSKHRKVEESKKPSRVDLNNIISDLKIPNTQIDTDSNNFLDPSTPF